MRTLDYKEWQKYIKLSKSKNSQPHLNRLHLAGVKFPKRTPNFIIKKQII